MEQSIWISLSYATFSITINDGTVTDTPPIAKWATGRDADGVIAYYRRRGATIKTIHSGTPEEAE